MPTVRALLCSFDREPALHPTRIAGLSGLRRFTVYCRFDEDTLEEIDVDALDGALARRVAERLLSPEVNHYEPGGRVVQVTERFGLYF